MGLSKKILFSWIGFKDLYYAADQMQSGIDFKRHVDEIRKKYSSACTESDYSPALKSIEACKGLSKIYFFIDIANFAEQWQKKFQDFVSSRFTLNVEMVPIESKDTHSYKEMFDSTLKAWKKIVDREGNMIPYFNLSSGTTAMNAIWIVLAGARFSTVARFIQVESSEDTPEPFAFDFDLTSFAISTIHESELDPAFDSIVGKSREIMLVKKLASKAALTDFNILIYGESGTGKELFAKAIHASSSRKGKRFDSINCAGLSPNLLESQLFGYKKGAYTGAIKDTPGIFSNCDGGTLFLDEVEACPPETQAKLLRALQPPPGERSTYRSFRPLGADKDENSDVRIIAATNEKLTTGQFRSDLLNRLATLTIALPPLRERKTDIRLLVRTIFENIKKQVPGGENKIIDESAINFIEKYPWPGNVRQLQNALTQSIVFSDTDEIRAEYFQRILPEETPTEPSSLQIDSPDSIPESFDIVPYLEQVNLYIKEQYMRRALALSKNKSQAAKSLGISYQTWDNWEKALEKAGKHIQ